MTFDVRVKKKIEKRLYKLPKDVQDLFEVLRLDLELNGPIRKNWKNFSPLGDDKYHCHLNYSYVACWEWVDGSLVMEVYYVGSREKAPY